MRPNVFPDSPNLNNNALWATLMIPKGRINRTSYFALMILCFAVFAAGLLILLGANSMTSATHQNNSIGIAAGLALLLPTLWGMLVLSIRRLNDCNHTIWTVVVMCIVTAGAFMPLLFVLLSLLSGDSGVNPHGEPRLSTTLEKLIGWAGIAIVIAALASFFHLITS